MENMEENFKMIRKIWNKCKSNSENTEENCEKIWKYGKKTCWNVIWYVKYGRNASWNVKQYGKYGRNVKWYGKYWKQLWKDMENMKNMEEK